MTSPRNNYDYGWVTYLACSISDNMPFFVFFIVSNNNFHIYFALTAKSYFLLNSPYYATENNFPSDKKERESGEHLFLVDMAAQLKLSRCRANCHLNGRPLEGP